MATEWFGACCDPTGAEPCKNVAHVDLCPDPFVFYLGVYCDIVDCSAGRITGGACCGTPVGCVEEITEEFCLGISGATWIPGKRCSCVGQPVLCRSWDCDTGTVKGACCGTHVTCVDDVPSHECDPAKWFEGIQCGPALGCYTIPRLEGACCHRVTGGLAGDYDCHMTDDRDQCLEIYDENFYAFHPGLTCEQVESILGACRPIIGACCFGTECRQATAEACRDGAGRYQGPFTDCADIDCEGTLPIEGCRTPVPEEDQRPPIDPETGNPFRQWHRDLCQNAAFGFTRFPLDPWHTCVGDCDGAIRDGDWSPVTLHPVRAMHFPEHNLNEFTSEVCMPHFGEVVIFPNGDAGVLFCSRPIGMGTHEHTKQAGIADLHIAPGEVPGVLPPEHAGDALLVGAYHAPYWVEAHLASDERRCSPPEV